MVKTIYPFAALANYPEGGGAPLQNAVLALLAGR